MVQRSSGPNTKARQRSRPPARQDVAPSPGLERQAPGQKLTALTFEHDRLLKAIGAKQNERTRLDRDIRETAHRLGEVEPIEEQIAAVHRQIHRLFGELMSHRGKARKERRAIGLVYEMLQDQGVLSSVEAFLEDERQQEEDDARADAARGQGDGRFERSDRDGGWDEGPGGPRTSPPPAGAGGFSARRPSDAEADRSLRGLFRRLAMAVHPDRVADDGEKARRTEAMKEISRAYEERDLARLLHLERMWMGAGVLEPSGTEDDALARKLAHLERTNADLRAQLRELTQALRELRRSPAGQLHLQLRRTARQNQRPGRSGKALDPVAELVAEARATLASLRELQVFVTSFRDGKLTLEAFMLGPAGGESSSKPGRRRRRNENENENENEGETEDEMFEMMEELLAELLNGGRPRRPASRTKAPGKPDRGPRDSPRGTGRRGTASTSRPASGRRPRTNDDIPF